MCICDEFETFFNKDNEIQEKYNLELEIIKDLKKL